MLCHTLAQRTGAMLTHRRHVDAVVTPHGPVDVLRKLFSKIPIFKKIQKRGDNSKLTFNLSKMSKLIL